MKATRADATFMRRALKLAEKGSGHVSPNPRVGCVIVKNKKIIAEGWHKKFGGDHAEIEALKKIKFKAEGATLYVSLEPCHHFGKTPPCVEAVLRSGVARVVIGLKDPNPKTSGKSIRKLRSAGIEVAVNVLKKECVDLVRFFTKHVATGMPYVIAKVAQSADGKIAERQGAQTKISGKDSWRYVQNLRSEVDAVLVGRETIRVDDPLLNVRHGTRQKMGAQPKRIVLDSLLKTNPECKILNSSGGGVIFIASNLASKKRELELKAKGAEIVRVKNSKKGLDLRESLKSLGRLGVTSILVEGGGKIFTSFLASGLVDEWHFLVSPRIIGVSGVPAFYGGKNPLKGKTRNRFIGKDEFFILHR